MKKMLVAIVGAMFLLGACGGDDTAEPAPTDTGDTDTEQTDETAGAGTYDAGNAEAVYVQNCAGCHGGDLGGASGPGLVGKSYDEVLAAIEEGPGSMPGGLATGQDAEDVAAWVSDQ